MSAPRKTSHRVTNVPFSFSYASLSVLTGSYMLSAPQLAMEVGENDNPGTEEPACLWRNSSDCTKFWCLIRCDHSGFREWWQFLKQGASFTSSWTAQCSRWNSLRTLIQNRTRTPTPPSPGCGVNAAVWCILKTGRHCWTMIPETWKSLHTTLAHPGSSLHRAELQ